MRLLICLLLSIAGYCPKTEAAPIGTHGKTEKTRAVDKIVDFKSKTYEELVPADAFGPAMVRETGTLMQNGKRVEAARIYHGPKGKPDPKSNDLYVAYSGKAKTFAQAKKACESLLPLGEWRVAWDIETSFYALPLMKLASDPADPKKKEFAYWSGTQQGTKNEGDQDDTFYVSDHPIPGEARRRNYQEWINQTRIAAEASKDPKQKARLEEALADAKDGIAVWCITGYVHPPSEEDT